LFGGKRPYMLAVVAAIIVFILVAPVRVHGDNMSPSLNDGDVVIILKGSYYDASPPEYGDVLCFKRSFAPAAAQEYSGDGYDERAYRFARVAGLPGDEMESRSGVMYRNGKKLSGPGGADNSTKELSPASEDPRETASFSQTQKVGTGEVYVLNDDSSDAMDSRDGSVDALLDGARGVAIFRVWPLAGFGAVD
jgi:signal peptidase I